MSGIALTLIVLGLLPVVIRRPVYGAYLWAWLGMMNPHKLVYGFARGLPFAQISAVATLIGFFLRRDERKPFPWSAITVLQIGLLLWMTVTSAFALNTFDNVFERWTFVLKIQLMLFVTYMLVRGKQSIEILIWVITMSICFYGIKGGAYTLATGGSGRVWGPPGGMLQGNNELAVALTMLVPLLAYLYQSVGPRRWAKAGIALSIMLCAFSILGSQSRGALLALLAMAFFLGIKGKHPVRNSLMLLVLVAVAIAFMPESWNQRMDTIQTYKADGSAMSRIYTWATLWNAAVDRPLIGAGFRADSLIVFQRYAPTGGDWEPFVGTVWVAHSIYFQLLGEHGFPGLAMFVGMIAATWWRAGRLRRLTRDDPEFGSWVPLLMPMVQVSLVGYAAGGAFLSIGYLDVPYYIMGLVVVADATVRERLRQRDAEAQKAAKLAMAAAPQAPAGVPNPPRPAAWPAASGRP
jgi:probable O-glycosylation ligase (exosortase A-associated)